MTDLKDKSLIITGGASGIGKAAVLAAAKYGARLTIADLDDASGQDVCTQARTIGAQAQFLRTDVASSKDVQALVAAAVSAYGKLDGAFNNAGIPNANFPFTDMPEDVFLRMQTINLTSIFLCIKYEALAMIETGGGAIVNTSSTAAISMLPNMADYGTAKAGVLALTRSAALDLGRKNIRVNAVLPGPTRSKMFDAGMERTEGLEEYMRERQPLGRIGEAHEVAAVALWLLSDDASIMTGACIPADGGLSIM
jgi:NAD(P)-dependent dehydrogenase (short-subunit alcohol dehydrogenase family)